MKDFERVKEAYDLLGDEISKEIFWERLKYGITWDRIHLLDMIAKQCALKPEYDTVSNRAVIHLCKEIMSRKGSCKVAIFGASDRSEVILELLYEYGLLSMKEGGVECFYVDNDQRKWGRNYEYHNPGMRLPIYSPEILKGMEGEIYVIIAVHLSSNDMRITKQLLDYGIPESHILHNIPPLEYFLGNMYLDEDLMEPVKGDVLCDVGAYDMFNTEQFIKWNPDYEHVYAFEADPVSYAKCKEKKFKENVEIYQYGIWSSTSNLSFLSAPNGEFGGSRIDAQGEGSVETVSLDDFLKNKKVSIIKMDIEGAELEALKGARNLISTQKPCLTISVYHKPEDIIELPMYVHSLNPGYKIYFRHHTYGIYDTVMYAIDKDR